MISLDTVDNKAYISGVKRLHGSVVYAHALMASS